MCVCVYVCLYVCMYVCMYERVTKGLLRADGWAVHALAVMVPSGLDVNCSRSACMSFLLVFALVFGLFSFFFFSRPTDQP